MIIETVYEVFVRTKAFFPSLLTELFLDYGSCFSTENNDKINIGRVSENNNTQGFTSKISVHL